MKISDYPFYSYLLVVAALRGFVSSQTIMFALAKLLELDILPHHKIAFDPI